VNRLNNPPQIKSLHAADEMKATTRYPTLAIFAIYSWFYLISDKNCNKHSNDIIVLFYTPVIAAVHGTKASVHCTAH